MSGAKKNDGEKPRVHLVPNELVFGAARAFGFGAKKYARYNWMKGMEWTRLRDAVERHLRAWTDGEETDPESGLSHLDHAAASLAMLMGHVERGLGKDDRHCTDADPDQKGPEVKTEPPFNPRCITRVVRADVYEADGLRDCHDWCVGRRIEPAKHVGFYCDECRRHYL